MKSFSEALSMANEMDYVMIPYELCEGMKESVLSFTEASQIKKEAVGLAFLSDRKAVLNAGKWTRQWHKGLNRFPW